MATGLTSLPFLVTLYYIHKIPLMLAQNDQFIYNGFHQANLHLDGTAQIHPNGLLQLTNNSEIQLGYAFYQLPLKFNTSSGLTQSLSFSTNFVFAIVPATPSKDGHGIAFAISPSWKFTKVVASNYLGLLNASNNGLSTNHLLAIELETIEGQEFQDIDNNHVGINVNSLKSIESATATYFSDQERKNISLELVSGNPMHLWIDYNETEKLLKVTLAPTSIPKPNRPLLSTHIDMSQILLESMFVGFSAATVTSDHYILGWSFNKSGQAQSLDVSKLPQPPQQRKRRAITCTDVFAFGAFVLEVACGRKPIEPQGQPEEVIWLRVFECWRKGAILDATDPRLESNYVVEEMKSVLKLGLLCSHSTPAARPSMKQVMQFLNGNADLPELPHESACFGNFTRVEESEILLSIPQSFGKYLSPSSSTDSILKCGR
ncbi:hypothetical protein CMV_017785 [Castanea mollissima]|uniref:Legume lectin domain-containing protein n=1 Tax=Castanea mollissima TaxID=60419 RepID=A0A8J4QQY0_9ROSI|nr:hypothetical protein CMV_017785 [Castanea mollissima]